MYPEILLLLQSSFTGKIIFDSPNKVVIMPMKVTVEGISFKIMKERIPVTMSGPDKSMTDSTTGDNLRKEAKNRQSPNVIPIIPLVINTSKYCLSIINAVWVQKAITVSKIAQYKDFTRVIERGEAFSPISFSFIVPIAQASVDNNAVNIPTVSCNFSPYNKYGTAVIPACSIIL